LIRFGFDVHFDFHLYFHFDFHFHLRLRRWWQSQGFVGGSDLLGGVLGDTRDLLRQEGGGSRLRV
jgi:hypothetical protein